MPRIDYEAIEEEWDDDVPQRRGRPNLSVEAQARIKGDETARVLGVDRGRVTVLFDHRILEARYGGTMRGEKVVVGDRVRIRPPRHETDVARVLDVLPRETVLLRTPDDTEEGERVVVANADQVVVVVGADYLEGGLGFVDRVLVAASAGGLDGAVCINKTDLQALGVDEAADRYRTIGYEVVLTSALTGEGLDGLRHLLSGCWTAFTGHSGVGKTSLFNRLVPAADREVGDLGRRGGRHTTVSSRAHPLPDVPDSWIVDTPGVRSFGLATVDPHDLADHFPELASLPEDARYDLEAGRPVPDLEIHPDRLASYRRFLSALRGGRTA